LVITRGWDQAVQLLLDELAVDLHEDGAVEQLVPVDVDAELARQIGVEAIDPEAAHCAVGERDQADTARVDGAVLLWPGARAYPRRSP
jgi:hypothetical protein